MQIESGKIPIILEPEKKNALFIGWDKEIKKAEKDIVYKANYRSVKISPLLKNRSKLTNSMITWMYQKERFK